MLQAMIFAAGLGTRLRPLTDNRPKALVEVAGKPLLEHLILKMKAQGFERIAINVHHFGEQIIAFLDAHDRFGLDIRVSDERAALLDTGGGLRKALSLLDPTEPVLVHNADIVTDLDLADLCAEASASPAAASLMVAQRPTSRYLLFAPQGGALRGWMRIVSGAGDASSIEVDYRIGGSEPVRCAATALPAEVAGWLPMAFSGIHVLQPRLYPILAAQSKDTFSVIDFYLRICRSQTVCAIPHPADTQWLDCGKPENLAAAEQILCSVAYTIGCTTD